MSASIGIRAFHLRRPFQTDGFGEFSGIGSRFIAGVGYMTQQVLARLHALEFPCSPGY